MLTRLSLAFRVLRGLSEQATPTVTREQYDEMRAFYQQQVIDLRKALDQMTRALVEERSPGTLARLSATPKPPRVVEIKEGDPEMLFP